MTGWPWALLRIYCRSDQYYCEKVGRDRLRGSYFGIVIFAFGQTFTVF